MRSVKSLYGTYCEWAFLCGVAHRKALISFFNPLIVRWRTRNRCFCCGGPAVKKCRTHGSKLCDSAFCRMEHRRMKSAVSGSLTKPFCEIYGFDTWKTHLLRSAVAVAIGLLITWIVAL